MPREWLNSYSGLQKKVGSLKSIRSHGIQNQKGGLWRSMRETKGRGKREAKQNSEGRDK